MSYPTIFRKRTIEYRQSGHTLKETSKAFKVSISAIEEWEKKLKERGNLENKALSRPHKKIDPEKLRAYVEEHPDAYQREMAEEFDCSVTAIQKALKRIGITRKKRQLNTRSRILKK
jgi:transposase